LLETLACFGDQWCRQGRRRRLPSKIWPAPINGVPILPPYYSLRLLPYVVPQIATWKRRMLREKDVADAMF
jgi:hypothetical protein